jgi:hypothetical protein
MKSVGTVLGSLLYKQQAKHSVVSASQTSGSGSTLGCKQMHSSTQIWKVSFRDELMSFSAPVLFSPQTVNIRLKPRSVVDVVVVVVVVVVVEVVDVVVVVFVVEETFGVDAVVVIVVVVVVMPQFDRQSHRVYIVTVVVVVSVDVDVLDVVFDVFPTSTYSTS